MFSGGIKVRNIYIFFICFIENLINFFIVFGLLILIILFLYYE